MFNYTPNSKLITHAFSPLAVLIFINNTTTEHSVYTRSCRYLYIYIYTPTHYYIVYIPIHTNVTTRLLLPPPRRDSPTRPITFLRRRRPYTRNTLCTRSLRTNSSPLPPSWHRVYFILFLHFFVCARSFVFFFIVFFRTYHTHIYKLRLHPRLLFWAAGPLKNSIRRGRRNYTRAHVYLSRCQFPCVRRQRN